MVLKVFMASALLFARSRLTRVFAVCGIERIKDDDGVHIHKIIPIAGDIDGRSVDPKITRLKPSEAHGDAAKEGVRVVLNGGLYEKKDQQAVVEFICDPEKTGLEGLKPEPEEKRRKREEDKDKNGKEVEKSLKFISYNTTDPKKDVLNLEWKTKHACEKADGGKGDDSDGGSHWGGFTWFIIMYLSFFPSSALKTNQYNFE
jgi:autophagy-related protein 27